MPTKDQLFKIWESQREFPETNPALEGQLSQKEITEFRGESSGELKWDSVNEDIMNVFPKEEKKNS
jgi:hypothetical protein